MSDKKFGINTIAVHGGVEVDKTTGAIDRPIVTSNSYRLPYDASDMNWSTAEQAVYTRNGGANQSYLEKKLSLLEGAEDTVTFASGVAALSSVFFTFLKTGDHIVTSDSTYIATYRLLHELLPSKYNITSTLVDTTDVENVKRAIKDNTKLVHIESPTNPTMKVCDIAAIAAICKEKGILLSVDNTFASPINQRPLELGADLSIESLTKYINGHGDAMGGSVSGKKELIEKIKLEAMVNSGGTISPYNAWLIMRGAVTLPLRMEKHNENGLKVAEYLESESAVKFVAYPGLKSHKGHEIAKKQMKGFSGVLSFGLNANKDKHNEFVSHLKIFTSAVSLGHDSSLIVYIGGNDERRHLYPKEFQDGFFRVSVGLENIEDLISDINEALIKTGLKK